MRRCSSRLRQIGLLLVALGVLPWWTRPRDLTSVVVAQSRTPSSDPTAPTLTVHGDPPDPTDVPPELKRVYEHIDANFESHLERVIRWVRIPSVSNTVDGEPAIWESARFIRDVIVNDLGCKAQIYAPGLSEWGSPGHPVVYGRCDVGAEKTLIDYSMGDAMPIFRPDQWIAPPFGGQIVPRAPYRKVLIGRAASNNKGKDMAEINALISIKAVTGTLPVNIIFVSEHDEERMDIGLRTFMFQHPELFKDADAAFNHGNTQLADGRGVVWGQSIGCVVFDLETTGPPGLWSSDQPMWRHLQMLTKVFDDDSRLIKELASRVAPPSAEEVAHIKREVQLNGGTPSFEALMKLRTGIRVTVTGTWGGNMAAGYAGRYTPSLAGSKIDIRFPPPLEGEQVLAAVRDHLKRDGFGEARMKVVGIVPWAWTNAETDVARALLKMYRQFNVPYNEPPKGDFLGPNATYYGPNYLFARGPLKIPMVMGGLGYGDGAHRDNEYLVVEGDGRKVYGFAGAMKGFATFLYNYAAKDQPTSAAK